MTAKEIKAAWNKFRRECRCTTEGGVRRKAWRVPGTTEAGRDAMFAAEYQRACDRA